MIQHFAIDDKPFGSAPGKGQNSLSGVAYFHTHGIKRSADRIPTAELRKLIQKLGGDPSGEFDVELPNGKRVSAKLVASAAPVAKRSASVKAAGRRKKASPAKAAVATERARPSRTAAKKATSPKAEAAPAAPAGPALSVAERARRREAAQAEAVALKEWEAKAQASGDADGAGPRPETPNLDAMNAEYEAKEAERRQQAEARRTEQVSPHAKAS